MLISSATYGDGTNTPDVLFPIASATVNVYHASRQRERERQRQLIDADVVGPVEAFYELLRKPLLSFWA